MRLRQLLAREGIRAAAILLLVLNACFFPFIWGNRSLLASARDASSLLPRGPWAGTPVPENSPKTLDEGAPASQSEPWFALVGHQFWGEHGLPLWNPYQAYGTPLAANMQSQPFYPLTIIYSLHPSPRTYNFYILLRLFAAGMCAYFFLRYFVSFLPAIAAGITSMLAGYYILYITMPQLSVEVLLPAALLACESLVRLPDYKRMLWWAVVVFLILTGGMPESSLVILSFAGLYFLWRLRNGWPRKLLFFSAGAFFGIALTAFLLLPFAEFLRQSLDSHQGSNVGGTAVGLLHDVLNPSIFTYLFPLLFGPLTSSTLGFGDTGLRNYAGTIAFFLIVIVAAGVFKRSSLGENQLRSITYFFLLFTLAVPLKRYGFAPLNALGALPLFRLVWFPKYEEVVLSVCVSVLCAIGLERLLLSNVSARVQAAAFTMASLSIPIALICSRKAIANEFVAIHIKPAVPIVAIGLPVILLLCLANFLILFGRHHSVHLARSVLALLIAEFTLTYIATTYYVFNHSPLQASNPYQGAPFIDFLKKNTSSYERVFCRGRILNPDWASAFQIQDIRDIDAMYYSKYFRFLHNFLPAVPMTGDTELGDRFIGLGNYDPSEPRLRRMLQLSSVRYFGTTQPLTVTGATPVYDGEIKIYALDQALPRAAVYFDTDAEPNETAVLQKLQDPAFNPRHTVALDISQLPAGIATGIHNSAELVPVVIRSYQSQSVVIDATLPRPGILVLNDSNYPGWTVTIDGRDGTWFPANFLFRGVVLPPGRHTVRFDYKPASFRAGLAISIAALLALILWGFSAPGSFLRTYFARYTLRSSRPGAPLPSDKSQYRPPSRSQ